VNDALGSPQSVLVLGGGSDIARAVVRSLVARRSRTVILAGRPGSTSLDAAAAEARTLGAAEVDLVAFDAANPASHAKVIDEIWERHGDIDLVLVAFGLLGDQVECEDDPAAAIDVATTNFTGAVTAGLAVARRLRAQGYGTLVTLSSVAGERVRRANFVYGATKAGMDGFYQGLADSFVGTGARVIIVRPGFVDSKMTAGMKPAPFATTPSAVAEAIIDALSSGAATVWVPPVLRPVFIVMRHLPRAMWRRMPG
jgi:decaprenylphospho-beta-D-erythro-pentofuranosid-2-ulose 2-reductase